MTGGIKGIRERVARSFGGESWREGEGEENRHGGEMKTVEKARIPRIERDDLFDSLILL
jgi:hypothetical protein